MNVYTIGFAQKPAKTFFEILMKNKVARVIDIRLHNKSQLAGFTKGDDLKYFLDKIAGIDYRYLPLYAPPKEVFDAYHANELTWPELEQRYIQALEEREILKAGASLFADACLLCSEPKPEKCHRRLLAEYLSRHIPEIRIIHL